MRASRNVSSCLFLKDLTHSCFVKTSMTHNKYLTFLFTEDNNPISVKSAVLISYFNLVETFLLLNFLIAGLCTSSASFTFELTPDPVFLLKNLYLLQMLFDIHHIHKSQQFHKLYLLKS